MDDLGDHAFTNEEYIITPKGNLDREHMANRARIEMTFGEFEATNQSQSKIWRYKCTLEAPTTLLCCELYNFRKRLRLRKSLDKYTKDVEMGYL